MNWWIARVFAFNVAIFASAIDSSQAQTTDIVFDSEDGDYIGQGQQQTFTLSDGAITATRNFDNGVTIRFQGDDSWRLNFAAPSSAELIPGPYEDATRFPFQSPTGTGLSVSGAGRGCNELTGRFDVREAVFESNGDVLMFAVDFEQHCEGGEPALFGSVRFNASGPPFPEPPDQDDDGVPDTADNCVSAANPSQDDDDVDGLGNPCDATFDNTFISFDSEDGDFIGQGQQQILYLADGIFTATKNFDNGVSIRFDGNATWSLEFAAANDAELSPGPYEDATRFPFQETSEAGLSVGGDGRGCNRLSGRFDIREAVFDSNDDVLKFSADFEQHCEEGEPALFGSVRFNATTNRIFISGFE